jgi:hypothetical protein
VAKLIGAPPGYVGHDEGGQLSDAIHISLETTGGTSAKLTLPLA